MPFFELSADKIAFPPSHFADVDGLLAEGGDITADWLMAGYKTGAFLWSSPVEPLRWWAPDPRIVLMTNEVIISTKLQKKIEDYQAFVTYNQDIEKLMQFCEKYYNKGAMNPEWLTGMFVNAYRDLYALGVVRSIEVHQDGVLIGGAFGTVIGNVFFGEYVCGDAEVSELALVLLAKHLQKEGVELLDLHKETMATADIGYREISKNEFVSFLTKN